MSKRKINQKLCVYINMRRNIHVLCGGIYRHCIVDNALPSNLFKITTQNKKTSTLQQVSA